MNKKTFKLVIRKEYCKGCSMCVSVCPFKVLELDKEFNQTGYQTVKQVKECKGCAFCYLICPDSAIEVLENE
jgi:2-oxoglutarate ferredoxin oxidoreductase subunit delta